MVGASRESVAFHLSLKPRVRRWGEEQELLRLPHPEELRPAKPGKSDQCWNSASCTMASLLCSQIKLNRAYVRRQVHENRLKIAQASLPYASAEGDANIIMGTNVEEAIETEEAPEIPILQIDQQVVYEKKEPSRQLATFKLPMWLLGP
ncbi:hypothetical protein ZWY2020_028335 [Hordeum vulgare]|nr:hypothetical protein ZWY2020_028335 [Hordeum vulgare]